MYMQETEGRRNRDGRIHERSKEGGLGGCTHEQQKAGGHGGCTYSTVRLTACKRTYNVLLVGD
jgi:hypothetical protein